MLANVDFDLIVSKSKERAQSMVTNGLYSRFGYNNSQRVETETFATRNTTNSEYLTFRENLAKTSTYEKLFYY